MCPLRATPENNRVKYDKMAPSIDKQKPEFHSKLRKTLIAAQVPSNFDLMQLFLPESEQKRILRERRDDVEAEMR
jgi:hypothetical protein